MDAELAAAQITQKEIDRQEMAKMSANAGRKEAEEKLAQFAEEIARIRQQVDASAGKIAERQNMLHDFDAAPYQEQSPEEIAAQAAQKLQQYAEIGAAHTRAGEALRKLETDLGQLRQALAGSKTLAEQLAKSLKELQDTLQADLRKFEQESLEALEALLESDFDLAGSRQKIEAHQQALQDAVAALKALAAQSEGQAYDALAHAAADEQRDNARATSQAQRENIGREKESLEDQEKKLLEKQQYLNQQKQLAKRADNLSILAGLFRKKGFVNYVSSLYLQELVSRANAHFTQLTRNQLSLEINANNDFIVRDMLNGGKSRSVRTLSGGQTFQASLSLALALADNVQQRSGSATTSFSLMKGLGRWIARVANRFPDATGLATSNRIVGVISHVEELQQEIAVYLRVERDEESGSTVSGNWEML